MVASERKGVNFFSYKKHGLANQIGCHEISAITKTTQNLFFHSRISVSTATGSFKALPARSLALPATPSLLRRTNGLVACSTLYYALLNFSRRII